MEDELFTRLYRIVRNLAHLGRRPKEQYSDETVLLIYFWAVLHDRPVNWACQQRHWPPQQRWPKLSPSQMSRRLARVHIAELMRQIESQLRPGPDAAPLVKTVDAKPLPVGSYSKDKHATWGQAGKAKAKGYKLFCISDRHGVVAWELHGMATPETKVARRLIPQLDGGGYLLGDALYDSNTLHEIAGFCNHRLIAPRKKPGTGLGNRRHSPMRLRCIDLLENIRSLFIVDLYKQRGSIERVFGHMGNFAAGLGPLPNWVRTLPRVRRWVHAKIIINALRLRQKQRLAA